jgi:hypothetical protein
VIPQVAGVAAVEDGEEALGPGEFEQRSGVLAR